ncbi:MAG: TrmH family RNA methyltransferase, partial [Methyloceanibacter sp.]
MFRAAGSVLAIHSSEGSASPMRRQKNRPGKPFSPSQRGNRRPYGRGHEADRLIFGFYAVEAALRNPNRNLFQLLATENVAQRLEPLLRKRGLTPTHAMPKDLDRLLGAHTVHQGVALEAEPLDPAGLDDVAQDGILLVLDQVTDPQNVGAALRSAAAFGAAGLVLTERK